MEYKIISDSASDIFELDGVNYQSVPLKIITVKMNMLMICRWMLIR